MSNEKNEMIDNENNTTIDNVVSELSQIDCDEQQDMASLIDASITEKQQEVAQKTSKFEKKRKTQKIIKLAISIICWTLCAFVLALCVSNLYQQTCNPDGYTGLFGIGEAVVASDSMDAVDSNPRIQKNDLVFYKEAKVEEVKEQDIVIYETETSSGTKLIIHRIIELKDDGTFVAKGDNNAVADDPMPTSAIVGQYLFKINDIGFLFNALSGKFAPIFIILFIVILFAGRVAIYFLHKKQTVKKITTSETNRVAINHFFDI